MAGTKNSKHKKKMLYICADRGIPFGGIKGGSIHIREFLETVTNQNIDATAVVARMDNSSSYKPDYQVYPIPTNDSDFFFNRASKRESDKKVVREAGDFARNFLAAPFLEQICDVIEADYIYERYSLFGTMGRSLAKVRQIPFVLEVNAPLVLEAEQYRSLALSDLALAIEHYLFTSADHIVSVSQPLADYIKNIARHDRITVIPNGVSPERFDSSGISDMWRDKLLGQRWSGTAVGFVGSVKPWHGVDLLIEAVGQAVREDENIKLCIVGETGSMTQELKEIDERLNLGDRLICTGAVPYESIPEILASLDIVVAPYPNLPDFYFSPLKLFEYMAAGKSIIASEIGQISGIVEDGQTALLVPPGDVAQLAEAILKLSGDSQLREKIGNNARLEVLKKHTWDDRIARIIKIYESLTTKSRADGRESYANKA